MAKLSLNKAAKEWGVAKTTILDALKTRRMSAEKNDKGHWQIDPSELDRVFPKTPANQSEEPKPTPIENGNKTSALEREVELLREMLDETRTDRDSWKEQAQKITALIEDQNTKSRKKWFWQRG